MAITGHLVLIIGAGPTGLALALWLTRLGVSVRIIDKAAEPGTTSRALAVQARTLEFYRQVNLSDAVLDAGVKVVAANLWVRGAKAARVPIQLLGEGLSRFPYALIYPQDAHERLLIERLDELGVTVERRTELIGFDQHREGVRAVLKRPDGSQEVCEAAYLAGCDGASSTVREALRTGFPGGTYSGLFYVADVDAAGPPGEGEITGFFFPFTQLLASHWVGIISLIILPVVIAARYWKHLVGPWRGIYVVGSVLVLYLNFFILIVQLFRRIPALLVAAPKQTEPPFVLTQLLVLALFAWLGFAAFRRFRPQAIVSAKQATAPEAAIAR